jgi:hypothetical protein
MLLPVLFEEKLGLGRLKFKILGSDGGDLFKLIHVSGALSRVENGISKLL